MRSAAALAILVHVELRCRECGMLREVSEGEPCADVGCAGIFQPTGHLGIPRELDLILTVVQMILGLVAVVAALTAVGPPG